MELYPRRASCSFVLDVSTRLTASDAVGWSRFPVAAVRAGLYPVATLGGSWLREDASVRLFFIWRSPKLGSPKGKVGAARRRVGLWQLRGCIGMLPSPTLLTGPLTVLAIPCATFELLFVTSSIWLRWERPSRLGVDELRSRIGLRPSYLGLGLA